MTLWAHLGFLDVDSSLVTTLDFNHFLRVIDAEIVNGLFGRLRGRNSAVCDIRWVAGDGADVI